MNNPNHSQTKNIPWVGGVVISEPLGCTEGPWTWTELRLPVFAFEAIRFNSELVRHLSPGTVGWTHVG